MIKRYLQTVTVVNGEIVSATEPIETSSIEEDQLTDKLVAEFVEQFEDGTHTTLAYFDANDEFIGEQIL